MRSKEEKKMIKLQKQREKDQMNNLVNVASSTNNFDFIITAKSKKDLTKMALSKQEIEKVRNSIGDNLNSLYDVVVSKRMGDTHKTQVRDLIRQNETINIYNSVNTSKLVATFLNSYITEAINLANRGDAQSTLGVLNTIQEILADAASAPQYYYDPKCIEALTAKMKISNQINIYQSEIKGLTDKKNQMHLAYQEHPENFNKNLLARDLKNINEQIEDKTNTIASFDLRLKAADKALTQLRKEFETALTDNNINLDDLINAAQMSKVRNEAADEKYSEALDELKTNNTRVKKNEFDFNETQDTTEVSEATLEELFK